MQDFAAPPRYNLLTRVLHWLLALLLVACFVLGLWLSSLGLFDSRQVAVALWHKSLGVLTGLLMLVRLLASWRKPALQPLGSRLEQRLARWLQFSLYGLTLIAVVAGYLLATGSGRELDWLGLVQLPALVGLEQSTLEQLRNLHGLVVWLLAALVGLHVAAVIKHQWLDRQPILRRML